MFLVISTSLHPDSRSRILATFAHEKLNQRGGESRLIDLAQIRLPQCDGDECYGDSEVQKLALAIENADGILLAGAIYNYDMSSSAKNLIELTGKAWTDKVVGFLAAAGGQGSYMSIMGLANSLMLDFRSLVLPRFVYATGDVFQGDKIADSEVEKRVDELVEQLVQVASALRTK